jgi:hypothetical protein
MMNVDVTFTEPLTSCQTARVVPKPCVQDGIWAGLAYDFMKLQLWHGSLAEDSH